jgi:hypothetical protein
MKPESVVVGGTVLPDGTLQVSGKVGLPAGPVEVEVRPVPEEKRDEDVLDFLARIRAEQAARGFVPRSAEEIQRYLQQMHDEWAEHDAEIEAIHEAARLARSQPPGSPS